MAYFFKPIFCGAPFFCGARTVVQGMNLEGVEGGGGVHSNCIHFIVTIWKITVTGVSDVRFCCC